ncbi:SGNH/GDSL hydrolase family protein [Cellulomonas sp. NS3]|uniref:SGNH/GDSL hydrolase family protein n=1 Tax=Cellulomonas sp. NS3 TaxID=2973977 RepID=UPI002161682A|nr:SGNH/GDSL hydrolase family protein [Cellulomonas sp. NS3]
MPELTPPSRRVAVPLAALAVVAVGTAGWALLGPGRTSSPAADAPSRTATATPSPTTPAPTPSAPPASSPPAPGPAALPDPDAPSIAFLGDSLTVGVGAPPERGYAWQTAEALGWPIAVVDGVSGSGFVAPGRGEAMPDRVDDVVAAAPEVVVVAGGSNDAFRGYEPAEVQAAATQVLADLRTGLPEATVVVLGPFVSVLLGGTQEDATTAAVRAAAEAAGVPFVDAAELVASATSGEQGLRPYLSADGLHPNETGYAVLAGALAERLPTLVP